MPLFLRLEVVCGMTEMSVTHRILCFDSTNTITLAWSAV